MTASAIPATGLRAFRFVTASAVLLLAGACFDPGLAGDATGTGADRAPAATFVPPKIGRPADRAGAGTRSMQEDSDLILLLVPDSGGFTLRGKPDLIWRLTEDIDGTMIAGIRRLDFPDEGAVKHFAGPFRVGWYALDLHRSDVTLAVGGLYQWTVELIPAKGAQAAATAVSYVERLDAHAVQGTGDAATAAARGLWFDALEEVFSISLSGRVRVTEPEKLMQLILSGGLNSDIAQGLP